MLSIILDGGWTFVTKNSVDFRGPAELFGVALDALEEEDNLINRVIEITHEDAGDAEIGITRYELPAK